MPTWQYVLILLLLLVLLSYPIWRRFALNKAHQVGANAGKALTAARLPATLEALATTVVLQTDVATATEVINQAVAAKPKKATAVAPGLWHVAFAERDDIHARLTQTQGGAELAVVQVIEFGNFPQGQQDWAKFLERIVEAAQARGIATREGTAPHLERVPNPNGDSAGTPALWMAPRP